MNLKRMSREDLVKLMEENNLQYDEGTTRENMIEAIHELEKREDLTTRGYVGENEVGRNDKKITVLIPAQDGVLGGQAVIVGVQGKIWNIPRDKEVSLPECVVKVLETAVQTFYEEAGKNDDGTIKWRERNVRRFPMQQVA